MRARIATSARSAASSARVAWIVAVSCPPNARPTSRIASTDARFTSVGTAAIHRFVRPVCFQNFPEEQLPAELRDLNERGIWRLIDGTWTRDDVPR